MELWIRSQKKGTLIEVKDIRIMQLDKDGFRALIEEDATEGWNIVVNDDPCVGTYKTKERALEVLDEIQDLVVPKLHHVCDGDLEGNEVKVLGLDYIQSIVYEMPKE